MNYSLGNTLSRGGGSLNPDGLSLDLQFATDKTLTARKGPTPTFTRASTATFVGSNGLIQSAAINEARFDHDPVTLDCKGLLIEESRTNLVFPSATLTTQTRTVTAVAHTLSFYGTGTVVLSGVATATVTGTGAYPTRTTLTFTPTAGSLILTVTGSVTEAQLEAGAFASSYIPTTTASVVRSADVCSITGSNFTGMYNQSEGSFAVEYDRSTNQSSGVKFNWMVLAAYNPLAVSTYLVMLSTHSADARVSYSNAATNLFIVAPSLLAANTMIKASYGYKSGDFGAARNGAITGTGTTAIPTVSAFDRIEFGFSNNGTFGAASGQYLNGHIASIRYFKKRLANAKLQTLTT